jgi:hypothetical protein
MGTSTSKATSSKKHRKATRSAFTVEGDQLTCGGLRITFQRTLRVSENGLNALPPGFGRFPLRPVRRSQAELAPAVVKRGGVMLPLYLREAMWLNFDSDEPVAVQIGAGGRCVVSGTPLKNKLRRKRQNYVVVPEQPWIDGFKTGDGEVRQFVGVAAGSGVSAEAQLTGSDTVGGIQIQVWHLTPEALERWRESTSSSAPPSRRRARRWRWVWAGASSRRSTPTRSRPTTGRASPRRAPGCTSWAPPNGGPARARFRRPRRSPPSRT